MPPRQAAAIPAAPRKTLLEWIEHDDGHPTASTPPDCAKPDQGLHAQIVVAPSNERGEPLQPPAGFSLAPLG